MIAARWLGCQRIDLPECGSTNDEAARLARAGARHGTIVIAEAQRAGRGRDGHAWASPAGGLYLSAVLRPPLPLHDVPPMTLAIGIGLCDAARAFIAAGAAMNGSVTRGGGGAHLKWPNDLLVGGKKLAGVLVESQSQASKLESVIVGIGVNLVTQPELDTAITLAEAAGSSIDREAFIRSLLVHVERWIDRYIAVGLEAIIPAWTDRMAHGLEARAMRESDGAPLVGHVSGLDSDGALLLRDDSGRVHRVRAGEVEVLRPSC